MIDSIIKKLDKNNKIIIKYILLLRNIMDNYLHSTLTIVDSDESYLEEYYWLKLISEDIFNLIDYFPNNWNALCDLIKPSQINDFSDSDFQNVEKESISYALFWYCVINWDKFQEIDINQIEKPKINREWYIFKFLLDNLYLIENERWKFTISNKFIKVFLKNGIFNLKKAKEKEKRDLERKQKRLEEKKIYKEIFDKVVQLYLYITKIDKPNLNTLSELKNYIEQKTSWVLTLNFFEKGERWCWDVFIAVNGVTFESDPIRNNISVWYMKWRSDISLDVAVSNFVTWIKSSGDVEFIKELALNLHIDLDNLNTDTKSLPQE